MRTEKWWKNDFFDSSHADDDDANDDDSDVAMVRFKQIHGLPNLHNNDTPFFCLTFWLGRLSSFNFVLLLKCLLIR